MKKLLSLLLAALLLASLIPAAVFAADVPTIKWVVPGNGMPDNYDAWKAKVDEYLVEKIGAKLEVEVLSWGSYGEKRNAIINGGEPVDILFGASDTLYNDISKGALMDLAPLLPNYKALTDVLPESLWAPVTVNGAIYAVPTYKDSAMAHFFVWQPSVIEKTGIDVTELNSFEKIEPVLKAMKEQGINYPYYLAKGGSNFLLDNYDNMGLPRVLGVRYDDQERKVVSLFEQEEIWDFYRLLHKWFNEGLINPDAATLATAPTDLPFTVSQGWPNAWKIMGEVGITVRFVGPIFSNNSVMGSLNSISSGCQNPEKAMEVLQLANTDTKFRDMLAYGLEGDNFEYTDDGMVKQYAVDRPWPWPRYTSGNHFILTPSFEDPTIFENIMSVNDAAVPSVLLGFTPDRSEIEDQLAYLDSVLNKYTSEICTGTGNPDDLIPMMIAELEGGGLRDVIANVQAQVDAFYADK